MKTLPDKGEVLGHGYPDWPDHLLSYEERRAYQLGVAHARAVDPSPIDMVLYCPQCGAQHVDRPTLTWTNPPHRSHLCACGTIWRPADVPTNGVAAVHTRGKDDTWPNLNPVCANCDTPVPPGCNGLFEKGKGCALNGGRTTTSEEFRRLHTNDEADFFDTQTRRRFEHG